MIGSEAVSGRVGRPVRYSGSLAVGYQTLIERWRTNRTFQVAVGFQPLEGIRTQGHKPAAGRLAFSARHFNQVLVPVNVFPFQAPKFGGSQSTKNTERPMGQRRSTSVFQKPRHLVN